jgi:protein TorT
MVEEANRLGVSFDLYEAGGYPNLTRQIEQIKACSKRKMDALIMGPVSYDGLTEAVVEIARQMPVIGAVNDMNDAGVSAKSSVSWREMGAAAGRAIAERHPKGSPPVRLAWFPGPKGAGWVQFVERGFLEALADSSAEVVAVRFGDTGLEQQVLLVEEVLDTVPDVDYLVGSGPMAEAAISVLRARGLTDRIGVVSTYVSHGVYRGIKRSRILAAPTDFAVMQGRLAIELAVRAIEGSLTIRHAGPRIVTLTPDNIDQIGTEESLAPAAFVPVFEVSN